MPSGGWLRACDNLVLKLSKSGSEVWAQFPLYMDQNMGVWFPQNIQKKKRKRKKKRKKKKKKKKEKEEEKEEEKDDFPPKKTDPGGIRTLNLLICSLMPYQLI